MNKWPVYKALYRTLYFSGVPLPLFIFEIFTSLFCVMLKAYLVIIPLIILHMGVKVALTKDPYILSIFMDLLSLKGKKKENIDL